MKVHGGNAKLYVHNYTIGEENSDEPETLPCSSVLNTNGVTVEVSKIEENDGKNQLCITQTCILNCIISFFQMLHCAVLF